MCRRRPHHKCCSLLPFAAILVMSAVGGGRAAALTITEIIDATGDGAGHGFNAPHFGSIAVDAAGNVYMTGEFSHNAFKITPGGLITEIINATGDGVGNILSQPLGIAVGAAGNTYVAGGVSHNAFTTTPSRLRPPGFRTATTTASPTRRISPTARAWTVTETRYPMSASSPGAPVSCWQT